MAKRVAVLAVNPVNGMGLFQYLEAFYENTIPFTLFAVAETPQICTNSGVPLTAEATIADLKGREADFDAVVFACGDAVPVFAQHADAPYNRDLMAVLKAFGDKGRLMIGHCGAGLLFDLAGITAGRRLAVHPLVKGMIRLGTATDAPCEIDANFHTAQDEHAIPSMIRQVVEALK